jgi:hypothetical protein
MQLIAQYSHVSLSPPWPLDTLHSLRHPARPKELHMMTRLLAAAACLCVPMIGRADVSVYLTRATTGEALYATYASGQAIADLPDLSDGLSNPVSMIRVAAGAGDTIGALSLTGTRATRLNLLVASPSTTQFPTDANASLPAGAAGLAGVSAAADLVGNVRLAASVTGSLSGQVDCGQIFRLEAATLDAPAIAHSADSSSDGRAVRAVRITSRVSAPARLEASSGGIENAQVGGSIFGDGLFGSVLATGGKIQSLTVTGEITVASPGGIRARDGIVTLRCLAVEGTPTGPIDADIDANTGNHADPDPFGLGNVGLIECGSLAGSVSMRSAFDGAIPPGPAVSAGDVTAPISVSEWLVSAIRAGSLTGNVTIGTMYGPIHATGDIVSVEVLGNMDTLTEGCDGLASIISDTGRIGSAHVRGDIVMTAGSCEAPSIIFAPLGIDSLRCDGDAAARVVDTVTFHYIPIGELVIGGRWIGGQVDCSSFNTFDIHGGMLGGVFNFRTIPSNRTVRVGGDFAGIIVVATPGGRGLQGQVITGADGAPHAYTGQVSVVDSSLLTNGPFDITGPAYTYLPDQLGGGAVGAVPFRFKPNESSPLSLCQASPCVYVPDPPLPGNYMPIVGRDDLESSGPGIILKAFGPIRLGPGAVVHCFKCNAWGEIVPGTDVGTSLDATVSGRTLTLHLLPGHENDLSAGRFVIRHYPNEGGILCDGLFAAISLLPPEDVPAESLVYNFYYLKPGNPDISGCADFNGDGDNATDLDIEDFFRVLGGGTCLNNPPNCMSADFNCDGEVTDLDIEAFFAAIAGHCPAACY